MKVALTVSQHFDSVKEELIPLVDAIVLRNHDQLQKASGEQESIYHTNGFVDDGFNKDVNNEATLKLLNDKVGLLSFDCGPSCLNVDWNDQGYVAASPTLERQEILNIMDRKMKQIRKFYKGEISLENLDYHSSGAYEHVCEYSFITEAIERLDTGLTLDIAHLKVTCHQTGIDPKDYIDHLPLARLKELHISRSEGSQDLHKRPQAEEYALVEYILNKQAPDYLVIEYYESPKGIIESYKELIEFLKRSKVHG